MSTIRPATGDGAERLGGRHPYVPQRPHGQTLADDAGSGNVTWLLADQQGSVRDVIDDTGSTVDHIVYDPYGNILSQSIPEISRDSPMPGCNSMPRPGSTTTTRDITIVNRDVHQPGPDWLRWWNGGSV